VTRSKELKRIEDALEHTDIRELQWAANECRLRLSFVTKTHGGARLRSLLSRIEAALVSAGAEVNNPLAHNPLAHFSSATAKRNRAERHQPGKPVGDFYCQLKRPSLDVDQDIRFSGCDPLPKLRRFLQRWLPDGGVADEGASFTFGAVVRHRSNQGFRRIVLCRWRTGESVNAALERAAERWAALQT
jgi:hypothetical protein